MRWKLQYKAYKKLDYIRTKDAENKRKENVRVPHSLEVISGANDEESKGGMDDLRLLVLSFHLLEVQLRHHVQVVGQLNDEEQFVEEAHRMFRVILPQQRELSKESISDHHICTPDE